MAKPAPNRRGVAATEMAVVAPVIVLFAFAVIEITAAIQLQQSLTVCAYEGVRVALQPDTSSGNVQAAVDRLVATRGIKGVSTTVSPGNFSKAAFGTPITVTVSAPANANSPFTRFLGSGAVLSAEATMMMER